MVRRIPSRVGLLALGTWHTLLMAGLALLVMLSWVPYLLGSPLHDGSLGTVMRALVALAVLWLLCLAATRLTFGPDRDRRRLDGVTLVRAVGSGLFLGAVYGMAVLSLFYLPEPWLSRDSDAFAFYLFSLFYAIVIGALAGVLGAVLGFALDYAVLVVLERTRWAARHPS